MAPSLRMLHIESYLKTAHKTKGFFDPNLIHAHIQLAGDDLTNNQTFKLLSGLLGQTLHTETIASLPFSVNPECGRKKLDISEKV